MRSPAPLRLLPLAALVLLAPARPVRAGEPAPAEATDDDLPPEVAEAPPEKKGPGNGSISEEVTATGADTTPDDPRGGGFSNTLNGTINLGEQWALDLGFSYLVNKGAPAPTGQVFADRGGTATSFSAGIDWDPNDHLGLGISLDLSPKSTSVSGTSLQYEITGPRGNTITVPLDAQLRAQSSSGAAGLSLSWDTAGDSDLEWVFTLAATGNHLDTTQVVSALQQRDGTVVSRQTLIDYCNGGAKRCNAALRAALKSQDYQLDSLELTAGAVATIFGDTDLGLTLDAWGYSQDPTQVGYFSIAAVKTQVSGGGGVPIAPMRADFKLEAAHRFGDLSAKLWFGAGSYVEGTGGGTYNGGLKVQYKLTKAFRLWLTLSARHDVDESGNDTVSRSGSLGLGLRF